MPGKPDNLVPSGERIAAEFHASPLTIPLWHHWALAMCLLIALLAWALERFLMNTATWSPTPGWMRIVLAVMVWLVVSSMDVGVRRYLVTDQRLILRLGVFSRTVVDMPLPRVQHSVWTQSVTQRLLGIGDVIVSSAGVDAPPIVFAGVANPGAVLEMIRNACKVDAARREGGPITPVIGLVGGIGSGKSTVAQTFAALGCLVVDADRDAREVLQRDDVVKEVVSWWGQGVLTPEGRVDRAKVAEIVFKDPAQRTRLEALVHPLVKSDRLLLIARARQEGRPAVVIDAPLLFEAGSDKDCDVVVFVDAPLEARLARVAARGWSRDELTRREAAQLPLDQKRARCAIVIQNHGSLEALHSLVRAALLKIRQDVAAGGHSGLNPPG